GGADANVFRNDGTQVGTITYNGDQGSGYFLNNGAVSTISYTGGSDTDTLVNNGTVGTSAGGTTTGGINFTGDTGADVLLNTSAGTINGLVFTGGADANTLVNAGTLTNASANFQGDAGAGVFVNQAGGTASNIIYNGGSDTNAFINYGSLSNATYNGDVGRGSMYLDGTLNQAITYNGGANDDELIIGPDASHVSTINFNGDAGTDLLVNQANGAQDITFQAGSDTANFWNFANNVSGLIFHGGSGADTFSNSGTSVTGIVFDAHGDIGADSLYNSGASTGTIVFSGGSDANILVNTGPNTGSIIYNAGSDANTLTNTGSGVQSITFNGDSGVNSVVNTGSGIGTITYTGGSDSDTLTNSGTVGAITFLGDGPAATFSNSGSVGTLVFDGGSGSASLIYSAIGAPGSSVSFTGHGGGNIFIDSGSAGSINVNLGSGDNQAVVMTGATGNVKITGGEGNNTFLFSGIPTANVTIDQAMFASTGSITTSAADTSTFVANPNGSGGVNTLDFSAYTGGGLSLDLMKTASQAQSNGLTLTLTDPEGISNVVGTQYTDQIYGNLRPDVIRTAALPDYRLAGQVNTSSTFSPDARTQWVYLDFDAYTVDGDHVYTADERAAILTRIEMDYYGPDPSNPNLPNFAGRWFNVSLTANLGDIPSSVVSAGQYATLYFNRTPPSGLPGGEASEVDLGNTNLGGYASIQINGMVDGGDQPPSIDPVTGADNFARLSAKIGAHELAHLIGVRHSDAFGPIGFGIHTPPGVTKFNPTYDGPAAAFETFDHLITSPATVGTTRFNDLRDLNFGPREAIKLAFASRGTTIVAPIGTQSAMASAKPITLAPLTVPNTDVVLSGVEKGLNFQVAALGVHGTIGLNANHLAAPDYYAISGLKGDLYTFEVDSQDLARLGGTNTIDSVLAVYDSTGKIVAFNDDQYEGTDSLTLDVTLPSTGTFYVKVYSFAAPAGDPVYDPANPQSPLNPGNLQSILNPLNPNFSQDALTSFLNAKAGTATGQYDLFIYRFATSAPTVADVHNVLVARGVGTTLSGSTGTDTLIGPAGTLFNDTNTGPGSAISIAASNPNPSVDLQAHFEDSVILTGVTGSTPWNVTISYGDGSAPTTQQVAAGSTIGLDHLYQATGSDTVTIQIQTGVGTFETFVPVSVILAQSPTEAITAPPVGSQFLNNTPVTFTGSLQNPYVGVSYVATWTFTNTADPSQVLTTSQTISVASATNALAFSTAETFATVGDYSVQLTIKNLANGTSTTAQTVGGSPAQVSIIHFITTTTTPAAPNVTYNGHEYSQATATVTGADQNVLGTPTVTFAYYNSADTGLTHALSAAPTDAGTYLAVATFAGDSLYTSSTSLPIAFTIGQAPLTITIADATKFYGVNDIAALTGTITGIQNNDAITASFASTGSAATAHVGRYAITASLSGNATTLADYAVTYTNAAMTQATGTLTVNPDHTTTQVTSSSASAYWNTSVTFTATVANSDSTISAAGGVEFYDGGTDLGHGTLAGSSGNQTTWTITTSALSPGTHRISASYTPTPLANGADFVASNNQASPLSQAVLGGPTTTTGSVSSATIFYGQAETFTATVRVGSTPASGTVDFFDTTTGTDLGTAALNASGVATLTTSVPIPAGTQSIAMKYLGGNGFTASSATVSVVAQPSIYVLNATASGALSLTGSSTITIPGLVQVNSTSPSAIQETGNTKTTAAAIRVVGGYAATGSSNFSTTPVKGAAFVSDPLRSLPIPSAAGLTSYAAVNLGANSSLTINPGIYPAINVSASAKLAMNPGIYVITGGGFSVNGNGSVTGSRVMIYNAGNNYNGGTGMTYGGFTIGGSGTVNLSAPTSGTYSGIFLFQSRDNARAISLSGAAAAALNGGVIYAPAALLNLSGSAQLGASNQAASSLIVNQVLFTGTGTSDLNSGVGGDGPDVAGQLLAGNVSIYVDNSTGAFTADELARIQDAVTSVDTTVAPYGVDVSLVTDPGLATIVITISSTSAAGSASDGVLGCESSNGITLLSGWNWYTGSDPAQVGAGQYDFETIVLHEIGHSLGLGHSQDSTSVMAATLGTGLAKRSLVTADLAIPDSDSGPCPLRAATDDGLSTGMATPIDSDPASQNPAEADLTLTFNPVTFAIAGSPPNTDAAARARQVAPRPQQPVVSIRRRPAARHNARHDHAINQLHHDTSDWLDGIALEVARKKAAGRSRA
ncbi:MAG: cya 2, partial [Planctomycetota bacterium]|nr:cya 2 [Planctomycetota bacterium]